MSRLHSSIPWPRQISSTATTSSSRNCFRHNTSFRLFFRIRRSRSTMCSRLLPSPPPFPHKATQRLISDPNELSLGHPLAPTNLLHHRHRILVTKLLSSQHLIWPLLPHPPLPQPHPQPPPHAAATLPAGVATTAIGQEAQRRKTRSSSLKWPLSTSPRSCSQGGSNRLTLITPSGQIFTRHRSIEVACGSFPR